MKTLGIGDVAGLVAIWAGAATIAFFLKDGVVAIVCLATAYYASKLVVLKKEP